MKAYKLNEALNRLPCTGESARLRDCKNHHATTNKLLADG